MRNFIYLSKLVVLLIALSGCTEVPVKTEAITISGEVTGDVNSVGLSFRQRTGVKEVEIKDNSFKITFSSTHPVLVRFYLKRYQAWEVFAKPGDKIQMNFNLVDLINSLNSITYIGDRKDENEFLIKMKNLFKYDTGDQLPFYNCPESLFLNKVDSLKSIASGFWRSYKINNKNCDPIFEKYIENYIRYICAFYINYYPKTYKANFAHPSYRESVNFKNKMNSVNLENPGLLDHVVYCDYLNYKITQKAKELMNSNLWGKNEKDYIAFKFKAINDMLKNKEVIAYSKFAALYSLFVSKSSDAVGTYYDDFMKNNSDDRYSNVLENLYNKHVVITQGAVAPEFSCHDIDSVYYSLKDFKGKYVYIDIWATWCVPCLAEKSHFERIIDNYSDNDNIVFIGISIDKDKDKWKKMVLEKKMKGIQLIADNAWKSTITHNYKINSIPRFLLIDKEGRIIDINAPRPSNLLIERTLANLLEK